MSHSPERRFLTIPEAVEVEEREGHEPRITGYGAVFYDGTPETEYRLWDNTYERISESAFDKVLAEETDTRALFNHDPNHLLGRTSAGTLKLAKLSKGLRYTTTPQDTQTYRDTLENIRNRNVTGSSFSFTIKRETWEEAEDGRVTRTIESVDKLFDVGPVTFPAYEETTAGVRSAYSRDRFENMEAVKESYKQWRESRTADASRKAALASYAARVEELSG